MTNFQNGTASYINDPAQRKSRGSGSTEQHYLLGGMNKLPETMVQDDQVLYQRDILAINGSVVVDTTSVQQQVGTFTYTAALEWAHLNGMQDFAAKCVRALLGRGPY